MRHDRTQMPDETIPPPPPKAAFTYVGQFIVHDLTRDDTPLTQVPPPEATDVVNHRTPLLDLDSVYGRGPGSQDSHLYEDDGIYLKMGESKTNAGQTFDIPFNAPTSKPLLADDRNNENIIIRQIHAMFLKLHNMAVTELQGSVPQERLLEKARQRVRWQYQWLVRGNYLKRICDPSVYKDLVIDGHCFIDWENCFAIPTEFAHAAARFGHSMVRQKYPLNSEHLELPIEIIFAQAHTGRELAAEFAVDWHHLFSTVAMSIDTSIVPPLFELGETNIRPFVSSISTDEPRELPVRTLFRAITMKLPTGQNVRRALDPDAPDPTTLTSLKYDPFRTLRELNLMDRIPLWYYLLLEAETLQQGAKVGRLGSRLVAEVIEGALRADPDSILRQLECNPKWRPAVWHSRIGDITVDTFYDLAVAVGLADPLLTNPDP